MPTLYALLSYEHGFLASDFGPDGAVAIESRTGIVHPVGDAAKRVRLQDLFKEGQYVIAAGEASFRFVVVGVGRDGLEVVSPDGKEGFLPWEALSEALRSSRKIFIEALDRIDELDDAARAFVGEEISRLKREASRLRTIASTLDQQRDLLQSMGDRPAIGRPSSWLEG